MPRAFVALPLPPAHLRRLDAYLVRCAAAAPDFRWVPAANLHLTLRFLGSVDDERLAAFVAGLREIRAAAFEVRLGALGTFGGRRANVVWLGLAEGREPATALAALIEEGCRDAGLEPEPRAFRPHVTLARARSRAGAPLPGLPEAPALDGWTAGEFVLYESRLHGARAPEYVALERFRLGW